MNPRKIIIIVFLLLVVSGVAYMLMNIVSGADKKQKLKAGNTIPEFTFYTLDEQPFTQNDLAPDKAILLLHFHPQCPDCKVETTQLMKDIDGFKNDQVLMVTRSGNPKLVSFVQELELNNYNQIKVLTYKNDDFYAIFGSDVNPSYYIYNSDHVLTGFYKGSLKMTLVEKLMRKQNP